MANNPFDSQKYQNFLNWFKDCKSNPYNQNTYLFGEGLSYYEQLSLIGSFLYDLKEYITTSDWTTGDELQAIIDQIEAEKQNVLISGENIKTINSESILSAGNLDLQEKLIAGQNIVISPDGKTISASGTVGIDYPNVSNKPQINGHTLQSGNNTLDTLGIQAKDDTILFQNDVIDNLISEYTTLPLSANQGRILDETKQDVLVSGSDIKTLDEIPLLGEGNIPLKTLNGQSLIGSEDIPIKTVGSESIFGAGNIAFKTINSNSLMGEDNITLMDLVSNPVNNDILLVDSNGQAIDSGRQLSSLANASDLQTTNKNIGTLSNLNTTNKNNLVNAINEVNNKIKAEIRTIVIDSVSGAKSYTLPNANTIIGVVPLYSDDLYYATINDQRIITYSLGRDIDTPNLFRVTFTSLNNTSTTRNIQVKVFYI